VGSQNLHGTIGIDTVRATTVGDDLAPPGERLRDVVEGDERSRPCAGDVSGTKLGFRPHVEKHHTSACESVDELGCRQLLDLVALAEVLVGENRDLGDVPRSDVPNCGPEFCYPRAREPVVDPAPVPARAGETTLREQPEMVRRSGDALPGLSSDLLYRPLALGK
jgi:hypothetical protein